MATTPTPRVTDLTRSHRLDIDTATFPASAYEQLIGIEDLKLVEELRTEEDEMYDDEGALRETNTGYSWRIEAKLAYSTNLLGTVVNAVHAFLRGRFKQHRQGRVEAAEFGVRFYHRDGLDDGHSHEGRVYVKQWTMPGGKGGQRLDIVLQGQGQLGDIANPNANMDPVVTGLSPATGTDDGGTMVNVYGTHLGTATGATGVKFGATNATSYVVVSDSHLVAVAPAGTAGTVAVTVTTPEGTSANTAADDYVYTA
ncbi:phage tail tube protein [Micromonospora sp. NPDC004704]